jgi:hypothetical protein
MGSKSVTPHTILGASIELEAKTVPAAANTQNKINAIFFKTSS